MYFYTLGIPEKIKVIEDEIHKTQINKATEHHVGLLKAKMARLKRDMEENTQKRTLSTGGGASGFDVRKGGDATVILIGLPSVGKSTLLNRLTNAKSKVASYQFTTLTAVPGMMHYRGSKIQILDMPGIIEGALPEKDWAKKCTVYRSKCRPSPNCSRCIPTTPFGDYKKGTIRNWYQSRSKTSRSCNRKSVCRRTIS